MAPLFCYANKPPHYPTTAWRGDPMWRETNLFGIYFSPLLAYIAAAILIYLPLRLAAARLRAFRWTWNPPLAEASAFVCILGLLVALL